MANSSLIWMLWAKKCVYTQTVTCMFAIRTIP